MYPDIFLTITDRGFHQRPLQIGNAVVAERSALVSDLFETDVRPVPMPIICCSVALRTGSIVRT